MNVDLSASEVIRRVALKTLAKHYPEGLRSTILKSKVEEQLGEYIEPDTSKSRGTYRSAIWNLHERFPEFVTKINPKPKISIFMPTLKLVEESKSIEIPDLEPYKKQKELVEGILSALSNMEVRVFGNATRGEKREYTSEEKMAFISSILDDIISDIQHYGIIEMLATFIDKQDEFSKTDIEAMTRLKFCFEMIKTYRKELFLNKL